MTHVALALLCLLLLAGCGSAGDAPLSQPGPTGADLDGLSVARVLVDATWFEVWLAATPLQQQRGLMQATPDQLAPLMDGTPRGMLFLFDSDVTAGVHMVDTYVPLDLAFIRSDGVIVSIHALTPLDPTIVSSGQPVRYALEVNAGDLAANGIEVGDVVALPIVPPPP